MQTSDEEQMPRDRRVIHITRRLQIVESRVSATTFIETITITHAFSSSFCLLTNEKIFHTARRSLGN